ncbi:hypothetical protein L3Q82_019370, partial [Scortum barcoo]
MTAEIGSSTPATLCQDKQVLVPSSCKHLQRSNRKHPDWKPYKLAWCTAWDRRALLLVIKTAQNIIGSHSPSISDISE